MRCFTGDECVDSFICDPVDFRAGGSGHNAYRARPFRTEIENFYRPFNAFCNLRTSSLRWIEARIFKPTG